MKEKTKNVTTKNNFKSKDTAKLTKKKLNKKIETKWHKLDNTAVIFPVVSNKNTSNVYRFSSLLKEDIQKDILQLSLDKTLPWFKTFKVKLKRGFFWYYYETNNKAITVDIEKDYPCKYIDRTMNNGYLFRVSYFKKRINLEVFHSITDGTGALNFLKALTYNYIKLAHEKDFESSTDIMLPDVDMSVDIEDSYKKSYRNTESTKYSKEKSYKIKGSFLHNQVISVIHGHINLEQMLTLCRSNGATITEYIAAVYLYSLYKEILLEMPSERKISLYIPVDLRKIFNKDTNMNFFSFISIDMAFTKEEYSFDEILIETKKQVKEKLTKENLSKKLAYNVSKEKNLFIRLIPLFIKNMGIKIIYLGTRKSSTTTITNMGKVDVADEFKKYIDGFSLLLSPTETEPIKISICSYDNDLVISFTSLLDNTYLERTFFKKLADDNISNIVIESNGVYNENL